VVIIGLVNTIWGVLTIQVVDIGIPKLLFKFFLIETPPNPRPKFVAHPINIPFMTKFVLGATTISPCGWYYNIKWLSNLYSNKLFLVIATFDIFGETELTQV
jgi:hypothetical protein